MSYPKKQTILIEDICVKVYDPTKKQLIAVYENVFKAANRLGLTHKVVQNRCESKERVFSPMLNLEIALRLSHRTEKDKELIDKTLKNIVLKNGEAKN